MLEDLTGEPHIPSVPMPCPSCEGVTHRDCSGCGERTEIDIDSEYLREVYCPACTALRCDKCGEVAERLADLSEDKYGCAECLRDDDADVRRSFREATGLRTSDGRPMV